MPRAHAASKAEQGAAFVGQQVVRLGVRAHVGGEHGALRNDAQAALARSSPNLRVTISSCKSTMLIAPGRYDQP